MNLFKIVPWFIGVVFFLIVAYWVVVAVVVTKVVNSGCGPQLVQQTVGGTTTTSIQVVCSK